MHILGGKALRTLFCILAIPTLAGCYIESDRAIHNPFTPRVDHRSFFPGQNQVYLLADDQPQALAIEIGRNAIALTIIDLTSAKAEKVADFETILVANDGDQSFRTQAYVAATPFIGGSYGYFVFRSAARTDGRRTFTWFEFESPPTAYSWRELESVVRLAVNELIGTQRIFTVASMDATNRLKSAIAASRPTSMDCIRDGLGC